jgi:peptidoglycan-N-acetylglucosamine deacetylase
MLEMHMTTFYLTIDDGPSQDTANMLKLFEEYKIPAIWFCLGKNLAQYPDAAMQIVLKGHIIGNHSYDHPYFSDIGFEECKYQITKTEEIIERIYKDADRVRPAKLFRFPYGEPGHRRYITRSNLSERIFHKEKIQRLLASLGFQKAPFSQIEGVRRQSRNIDWFWSYDIRDWAIERKFEEMRNNFQNYLRTYDKEKDQIILLHDNGRTSHYFPQFIAMLLEARVNLVLPKFN